MSHYFVDKVTEGIKPTLNEWWNSWGQSGPQFDSYPEIAMVLFHHSDDYSGGCKPIASWCAYKTDTKLVYLDNFIADLTIDKQIRDDGMDILMRAVLSEARRQGFTNWSTTTKIWNCVERAKIYKMTQYSDGYYWMTGEL